MNSIDLVFGTTNDNKLSEIRSMLPSHIQLLSMKDLNIEKDLPETQNTIKGNAIQKVNALHSLCQKNCFAEDTGLQVKALNGAPGVKSARYAGSDRDSEKNMTLLLQNLEDYNDRSARFITIIALIWQDALYTFEGVVNGSIGIQQKGTDGFGYDPLFIPDGYEKSFGQLPSHIKNQMSHRARAVNKLLQFLKEHF